MYDGDLCYLSGLRRCCMALTKGFYITPRVRMCGVLPQIPPVCLRGLPVNLSITFNFLIYFKGWAYILLDLMFWQTFCTVSLYYLEWWLVFRMQFADQSSFYYFFFSRWHSVMFIELKVNKKLIHRKMVKLWITHHHPSSLK